MFRLSPRRKTSFPYILRFKTQDTSEMLPLFSVYFASFHCDCFILFFVFLFCFVLLLLVLFLFLITYLFIFVHLFLETYYIPVSCFDYLLCFHLLFFIFMGVWVGFQMKLRTKCMSKYAFL